MELLPNTQKYIYIAASRTSLVTSSYYSSHEDKLACDLSQLFNDDVCYSSVEMQNSIESMRQDVDYFKAKTCRVQITYQDALYYREAESGATKLHLKDYIAKKLGISILNVFTSCNYGHRYAQAILNDFTFKTRRPYYYVILKDTIEYIPTSFSSKPILTDRSEFKIYNTFCKNSVEAAFDTIGLTLTDDGVNYPHPFVPNKLNLRTTAEKPFKAELKKHLIPAIKDAVAKMFDGKFISLLQDCNISVDAFVDDYYVVHCSNNETFNFLIDTNFVKENTHDN